MSIHRRVPDISQYVPARTSGPCMYSVSIYDEVNERWIQGSEVSTLLQAMKTALTLRNKYIYELGFQIYVYVPIKSIMPLGEADGL